MLFQNVPTLDYLHNQKLVDYQNQVDKNGNLVDVAKGTITFIDSRVYSSSEQSLYYGLKYAENQTLPNIASSSFASKKRWASIFGLTLISGETETELLQRITDRIQNPPAGGNYNDWLYWIGSVELLYHNTNADFYERVSLVSIVENLVYKGSIDFAVVSNMGAIDDDGNQIPRYDSGFTYLTGDFVYEEDVRLCRLYTDDSGTYKYCLCSDDLITAIKAYCDIKKPFGIPYEGADALMFSFDINITIPSAFTNFEELENACISLIEAKLIGDDVYKSDFITLLHDYGINTSTITSTPTFDGNDTIVVAPLYKSIIGTISVHN